MPVPKGVTDVKRPWCVDRGAARCGEGTVRRARAFGEAGSSAQSMADMAGKKGL